MDNLVLVKVILRVLNPIIVSLTLYIIGISLFRAISLNLKYSARESVWRKTLIISGAVIAAYAVVDSAFAYRRLHYSHGILDHPVIVETIPAPSSIVLVNVQCQAKCLERLVAGVHSEVISISTTGFDKRNGRVNYRPPFPARRFSIQRTGPNECPADPDKATERQWLTEPVLALRAQGICPTIESVIAPDEGIFIVHEFMRKLTREPAADFTPQLLVTKPPGPLSYFNAIELQRRSKSGVEVLAHVEAYEAPGFLGFPPLVGCWERPDNVLFILPPGDAGCGLWRLITASHNQDGRWFEGEWVYSQAFSQP